MHSHTALTQDCEQLYSLTSMPSKKNAPALPEDWSYEETLARIEAITAQLETGEMPLAEVFDQFSEAVSSLNQCDQFLQAKQKAAALLIETLVDGEEVLVPEERA